MLPQVIALFCAWYGGRSEERVRNFVQFYDHPFQRNRAIRLVAMDGEKVAGFQSFIYWPYQFGEKRFATFQSGASLVASDYRGRGIFAQLLNHLDGMNDKQHIDFLMGFPVEMSFSSFLRNGWANPFNLTWYAKVIHPLSVLFRNDLASAALQFETRPELIEAYHPKNSYSLTTDREFEEWRRQYRDNFLNRYFHHASPSGLIRFDLKFNQRGRIVEVIIGNVLATSPDPTLLDGGIRALVEAVRNHRFVTILTIALNRHFHDESLLKCLRRQIFFRLKPQIHFIVKDVQDRHKDFQNASRWRLYRNDIDTW
jgi:GNAT superfamily N-acetyltransferase